METPKVFISHASEDKDRFVIDFATKLRSNGVEAWVDQWEINIGDSLIDKIFEQGISDADAFIIVLSHSSIQKPWVREELNAAAIKRIEKNTKVIPLIIDMGLEVPEVLKTTVWETIDNIDSYDDSFHKILASIFGVYEKPPLGDKPTFAIEKVYVQGLSDLDASVFKAIGDHVFENDNLFVEENELIDIASRLQITQEELSEIIDILEDAYLLKITRLLRGTFPMVQFNDFGVIRYAEHFIPALPEIYKNLIALVVNGELTYSSNYAKKLQCQTLLIDSLINDFESSGYVKVQNALTEGLGIYDVTASGKRYFRQHLEDN